MLSMSMVGLKSAVCITGIFALSVQAERIAGDDFEDYPVQRLRGSWTSSTQVAVANEPGMANSGSNYVAIPRNPDGTSTTLYSGSRNVPYDLPAAGVVRLDFYTYTAVTAGSRDELRSAQIRIGNAGDTAKVTFHRDGKLSLLVSGRQFDADIKWNTADLVNRWNQHTLVFNLDESVVDYSFNGTKVLEARPVSTFADFGKFEFRAELTPAAGAGGFRIDDIKWTAGNTSM